MTLRQQVVAVVECLPEFDSSDHCHSKRMSVIVLHPV